jgi:hypothetical protein
MSRTHLQKPESSGNMLQNATTKEMVQRKKENLDVVANIIEFYRLAININSLVLTAIKYRINDLKRNDDGKS